MANPKVDWDALQRTAVANLIGDFKQWFDTRQEKGMQSSKIFINQKLLNAGLKPEDISQLIASTALDETGSNVFLSTLLDLLDILKYDYPNPDCVATLFAELEQAYYFANQRDEVKGVKLFYDSLKAIAENSTRLDNVVLESKGIRQKFKKLNKNSNTEENKEND